MLERRDCYDFNELLNINTFVGLFVLSIEKHGTLRRSIVNKNYYQIKGKEKFKQAVVRSCLKQ